MRTKNQCEEKEMAKPAFIYAFDNLGPYRFTELCGELLGSRYHGFMLEEKEPMEVSMQKLTKCWVYGGQNMKTLF